MTRLHMLSAFLMTAILSSGVAIAKLPPPPPMDEKAQAAADQKKAKDAAAAEAVKQQQGRAEDRVVARYQADMRAQGKAAPPPQMGPTSTPAASSGRAGTNKGVASQPLEKAEAHSDSKTVR